MMKLNRSPYFDLESESAFYFGLDIGQVKDYSALVVVERRPGALPEYHVLNIKRFKLGTSYPEIVELVQKAMKHPCIQPAVLLIDNTGVGMAVSDLFRQAKLFFWSITITGGDKVAQDWRSIRRDSD